MGVEVYQSRGVPEVEIDVDVDSFQLLRFFYNPPSSRVVSSVGTAGTVT